MRIRIPAVVLAMSAIAVGCLSEVEVDDSETVGNLNASPASQEFDPSNGVVPLPNILTLSPTTGRNDFPVQCGESTSSAGLRTTLNQLDGSGTWKAPLTATFTEQVDLASVEGRVFLYKVSTTPGSPIPTVVSRYQTVRYDAACAENNVVEGIAIVATQPLDDNSLYTVAITSGVKGVSGDDLLATSTFKFVSGENAPAAFTDANGNGIIEPQEV
ncbi:MAG: Ig-like domain-containing protein, partial [Clostridia bacterium]|nr:Ig-like domain-containing protein [Deltaproteobacteria bacterium]